MGNSSTKESRHGEGPDGFSDDRRADVAEFGRSRGRVGRGDLGGFWNLQPPRDRDRDRQDAPFEHRETRQEREARKLEKERIARAKERERSLREEHVDGGYLVTLGTYTGTEDFSKPVVRQLQVCWLSLFAGLCKLHNFTDVFLKPRHLVGTKTRPVLAWAERLVR